MYKVSAPASRCRFFSGIGFTLPKSLPLLAIRDFRSTWAPARPKS